MTVPSPRRPAAPVGRSAWHCEPPSRRFTPAPPGNPAVSTGHSAKRIWKRFSKPRCGCSKRSAWVRCRTIWQQPFSPAGRNDRDRFLLPRSLVLDAIEKTPKVFHLHGRDPARSITVGGDAVHFGTGGAAVQTLDIDSGLYRPSTLQDLHGQKDFLRDLFRTGSM